MMWVVLGFRLKITGSFFITTEDTEITEKRYLCVLCTLCGDNPLMQNLPVNFWRKPEWTFMQNGVPIYHFMRNFDIILRKILLSFTWGTCTMIVCYGHL